jgi:hypothetical protein
MLAMRSIWAVATNTIRQALRLKIAAAFLILLLILLPVMGVSVTGDGTLKGRLQTFISYGLSLTSILLCLLTIVVSAYSLTSDIKQRQIYTVITKPIRRFQFLLGKLLGVALLDIALLFLFSIIIYGIAVFMPRFYNATATELTEVNNEFYTARAGLAPPDLDVSKEVEEVYNKLKKAGQLPEDMSYNDIIKQLTSVTKLEKRAVAPGYILPMLFTGIKPIDPNESLFIRFKYDVAVTPVDSQIIGRWRVGDYRQIRYGEKSDTPIYDATYKHSVRTIHEIEVPASVVPADGRLCVAFANPPINNTVVFFPIEDGLEVLYKADTFTGNFVRAVLLIFFRLIFLASLGILAASFLSFPVAILFCLAVFFTATFSNFVIESISYLSRNLSSVYSYTVKPVIQLLPQFDKFNPTKFLIPARLLSWIFVAKAAAFMVCIKSLLLLLIALLIFSFKEIAKIIV